MNTQELAKRIRIHSLEMTNAAKTSHIGSCLSCADILAVLYGEVMQYKADEPEWEGRDRFIMSKGHAAAALYATLAECGFFPVETLDTYSQSGSLFLGHASHKVPGVEASTGSLGHGLSIGCGMAMSTESRVFVLLSDGDLNEGATWEAIAFAVQHNLNNLTVIVDYNELQALGDSADILDLSILSNKWYEFGWFAQDVEGHDHHCLSNAIECSPSGPNCVIALTVKGKGVSWMENRVEWHYRPPSDEDMEKAIGEIRK